MNRYDTELRESELAPVVQVLRDGLIERPTPQGPPYTDLREAIESCAGYFASLRLLEAPGGVFAGDDLLRAAEGMVEAYRHFWSRPFPAGLEDGQVLYAAILERPMRDLLRMLERLPMLATDADADPLLKLDAEEEVARFDAWVESLPARQRPAAAQRGRGFGSLAAAFLFGWWVGRDR